MEITQKLAAKNLYKKLTEEVVTLMVVWYKGDQPTEQVKNVIKESLNIDLPECCDKDSFNAKTVFLLHHITSLLLHQDGTKQNTITNSDEVAPGNATSFCRLKILVKSIDKV